MWQVYKEFHRFGKLLFQQGLISLTAGNISILQDRVIYITASGSMLGDLNYDDIASVPLDKAVMHTSHSIKKPSVELVVHRSIYENTEHKAVVHAHAPTAVAVAFQYDSICFPDSEGRLYVPEVPVIDVKETIGSSEVAQTVPSYLNRYPAVIIRGHGVFAAADTLAKACGIVSTIEFSSQILYKKEKLNQ
jgi:L-fuculose-phosphate aldolase